MRIDPSHHQKASKELELLNKKQKRLVSAKEAEIGRINKNYDKQIEHTRKNNDLKLDEERSRLKKQMAEATKIKDEKLGKLKDHLDQTKYFLNKEEKLLKDVHHDRVSKIVEKNRSEVKDLNLQTQDRAHEITERMNDSIKDLNHQAKQHMARSTHEAHLNINRINYDSNAKVQDAQKQQADNLRKLQHNFKSDEEKLNHDFTQNLHELKTKQEFDIAVKKRIHRDNMNQTQQHNDALLKSERSSFQNRYQKLVDEHKDVLSRIKDTFAKQINDLKLSQSKQLNSAATKANDPFYAGTKITPQVTEDPKAYYISLAVPEHEKDFFTINGYDREIKLIFSRKYAEKAQEGQDKITTSRTESLSRTFNVKDIVNANKVTQKYENGTLTFKVNKA